MYEFLTFHYGKLISIETFLYDFSGRLPFAPLSWATFFSALSFFPLALCLVYTPSSLPSCLIFCSFLVPWFGLPSARYKPHGKNKN